MSCDAISSRSEYQQRLRELNPAFLRHHAEASHHVSPTDSTRQASDSLSHTHTHLISHSLGAQPVRLPSSSSTSSPVPHSLRPDGDSNLPQDLDFSTFQLPSCPVCTDGQGHPLRPIESQSDSVFAESPMQHGILKPDLVFFGANVPKQVHARADELLASCDGLLVVGTSLTVWSAFRLMHATLGKIVAGQEISVIQLADMVARANKLEAQERKNGNNEAAANSSSNSSNGSNTISDGAATLNPVTPFERSTSPSTSAALSALSLRRVPSSLPIVILNEGPTRADPLLASASNVVKVEHVRASRALRFILDVPEGATQGQHEEAAQQNIKKARAAKENIE